MQLFGFRITRSKGEEREEIIKSVITPDSLDGAIETESLSASSAGLYTIAFDLEDIVTSELNQINVCRKISRYSEVDEAIENIVNDAIAFDNSGITIELDLDNIELSPGIKDKIVTAFEKVLKILNFKNVGYDIFEKWYVDGKIYYQIILNEEGEEGNEKFEGIKEVRNIEPYKLKLIREYQKERINGVEVVTGSKEYYVYSPDGFGYENTKKNKRSRFGLSTQTATGVRIETDSIATANSGIVSEENGLFLSHLTKAIRPANQLKMLEDSLLVYTLTRAPEKRIFYVGIGDMSASRGDQYVKQMQDKFKTKIAYDPETGDIVDNKRFMSMVENFWIPRRDDGKTTEITTLQGGDNLSQMGDNLDYFKTKLYQALNVPLRRMQPDDGFTLGRTSEITREEIKFSRFVDKLRNQFNKLFLDLLRVELITTKVMNESDWDKIKSDINFKYSTDNHFTEMKEAELLGNRLELISRMRDSIGVYYSREWVQKNILQMTDEDIAEMKKQMDKEAKENPPEDDNDGGGFGRRF